MCHQSAHQVVVPSWLENIQYIQVQNYNWIATGIVYCTPYKRLGSTVATFCLFIIYSHVVYSHVIITPVIKLVLCLCALQRDSSLYALLWCLIFWHLFTCWLPFTSSFLCSHHLGSLMLCNCPSVDNSWLPQTPFLCMFYQNSDSLAQKERNLVRFKQPLLGEGWPSGMTAEKETISCLNCYYLDFCLIDENIWSCWSRLIP